MNRPILILAGVLIACSMVACGGNKEGSRSSATKPAASVSSSENGLEMPEVPSDISDPQARADYLLLHFWDKMNFSDSKALSDSVMLEQTMSNFVDVMNYCSLAGREAGVKALLDAAGKGHQTAYSKIMNLADLYLWQADSPFRNEAFYALFAQYEAERGGEAAERAKHRLDEIRRNAPGTLAPSFTVKGIDGRKIEYNSASGAVPTVIMFYQPDCDHCEASIERLRKDINLDRAVGEGKVRMLAVYIGEDEKLWKRHAASLPDNWEIGIDRNFTIDDRDLYVVRATPSVYVISPDGRILVKDAGIESIPQSLSPYLQ